MDKKCFYLILMCMAIYLNTNAKNLVRFYQNALVGYKNEAGETIVPATFEAGSEFSNGIAIILQNGGRGLINDEGQTVLPPIFQDLTMPENGVVVAKQNGKYGILSLQNKWIVAPIFDNAYGFANGFARVMKNNQWGFIASADPIMPKKMYQQIGTYNEGLAPVCINNAWGYINAKGKLVMPTQFDFANAFAGDGTAVVLLSKKSDEAYFIINKSGKIIKEIESKEEDPEVEHYHIKNKANRK
jgi:hypothetical protein